MKKLILIIAAVLLFAVTGLLFFLNFNLKKSLESAREQLAAAEEQKNNQPEDTDSSTVVFDAANVDASDSEILDSPEEDADESVAKAEEADDSGICANADSLTISTGESARIYADTSFTRALLQKADTRMAYLKEEGYVYGDFQGNLNPAFYEVDEGGAKHISCDRFVGWVLYDVGYPQEKTDRLTMGNTTEPVLCPLEEYLLAQDQWGGFERIDNKVDLQAGDIVILNNPEGPIYKYHTYILADHNTDDLWDRYDAGIFFEINAAMPVTTTIENSGTINASPYENHPYDRTFDCGYRAGAAAVTFASSDESVAVVSANGTVTGKKPGKCTITIEAADPDSEDAPCQVEILVM